jgi:predicted nuclease of restriction endonuclease-like (RecB) superfamily
MPSNILTDSNYKDWLLSLKNKVRSAQLKAAVKVNEELLQLYWDLGADIVNRQSQYSWGDGFITQLSKDLTSEFPDMKGFSKRNLELMRQWYLFWYNSLITKQAVSQLAGFGEHDFIGKIKKIPWGHNIVIISRCKNQEEAVFYVNETIRNGWSRSVLVHQIESTLFTGKVTVSTISNQLCPSLFLIWLNRQ